MANNLQGSEQASNEFVLGSLQTALWATTSFEVKNGIDRSRSFEII